MRKKHFFIAGIALLCLAGRILYVVYEPHRDVREKRADLKISAEQLCGQYQSDEKGANKKFLNKVLEVKGLLQSFDRTDTSAVAELKGEGPAGVSCSLSRSGTRPGSFPAINTRVTVKGRCAGFLLDVVLVDAVFE